MQAPVELLLRIGSTLVLLSVLACTDTTQQAQPVSDSAGSVSGGGTAGERELAGRGQAGKGGATGVAAMGGNSSNAGGAGHAGGGRAGAGGAGHAGGGHLDAGAADGGGPADDAGADDMDAAVVCDGEIVADQGRCLQDDAFCEPLADGRFCTGSRVPECPPNSAPIAKDVACPARTRCWDYSESLRCASRLYTPDECEQASGVALADPGDGSLVCPDDVAALGAIDGAGWDEGGLCCPARKQCGARAGDTCASDEYCAYQPGGLCGAADAQATCKKRPSSCSGPASPVCGCDHTSYASECEANAAGSGIYANAACQ